MAKRTTSAPSTASTLPATTRMPYSRARWSRRSARGWLAMTWLGSTSALRSRPATIASAMTPEPTVAVDGRMVVGAGLRVRQRIDDRERAAGLEPPSRKVEERRCTVTIDMAQPEAEDHRIDRPVRLGPGIAEMDVGAQAVGEQALAGTLERRL